jgi:hypothetical protein
MQTNTMLAHSFEHGKKRVKTSRNNVLFWSFDIQKKSDVEAQALISLNPKLLRKLPLRVFIVF